jgi:hypothetical protein
VSAPTSIIGDAQVSRDTSTGEVVSASFRRRFGVVSATESSRNSARFIDNSIPLGCIVPTNISS